MARNVRFGRRRLAMLGNLLMLGVAKPIGWAKPTLRPATQRMSAEDGKRRAFAGDRHTHDLVPWPDAPAAMKVALADRMARDAAPASS